MPTILLLDTSTLMGRSLSDSSKLEIQNTSVKQEQLSENVSSLVKDLVQKGLDLRYQSNINTHIRCFAFLGAFRGAIPF